MHPELNIWTDDMIAFLKSNYSCMNNRELAKVLNLKLYAVRKKCYELGMYRMLLDYWTPEQVQFLKDNFRKMGDKELAIIFNLLWEKEKRWTLKHIEKKRMYLKLKRSQDELKRIKLRNKLLGCFKNTTTWKTRGEAPDGTIKIWRKFHYTGNGCTVNKFKVIKVNGEYVHYAPYLYEKEFGPMPEGCVIGFKDRDNMNVVPENLEAITRAEHARRNISARHYPAELKETIQLINKIQNQVYERQSKIRGRRPAQHYGCPA